MAPCPIEALLMQVDVEEAQPDPTPVPHSLLGRGADLLAVETRRGEGWAVARLEEEGADQAAAFLQEQLHILRQHAPLD